MNYNFFIEIIINYLHNGINKIANDVYNFVTNKYLPANLLEPVKK